MSLIKEFSIAQRINVFINGKVNKECESFLNKIYYNFETPIDNPKYNLRIEVGEEIPKIEKEFKLGMDGYYNNNTLVLKSGHYFTKDDSTLIVGIPKKVKRGRIPFKRSTPGRHITDEIIEPILQLLLLKCDATFVHASSIYQDGKVDVLMGWRGTGKTNAILKEINLKEIWSDDLSIIDSDGYVFPYLRPIRIYSYNIPLLDEAYVKENKLKLKSRFTPPWRPVHYLPLTTKTNVKKASLNQLIYLNDVETTNISKVAENIMNFEQLFFKNYQIMLELSKVLKVKNRVEIIINKALNNSNKLNNV